MVDITDFKKKEATVKKTPDWFDNAPESIKNFYWHAIDIFEDKKCKILSSKELGARDRDVSITEVTALEGKSRSAIRKDRHGYFIEWLKTLDDKLEKLYEAQEAKRADYRTRAEVIEENRELKLALSKEKNKNLVEYCQESIANHTTKNMQTLQIKLKQSQIDLESAYATIANLRQGQAELMKHYNK